LTLSIATNLFAKDWYKEFDQKIAKLDVDQENFIIKLEELASRYKEELSNREKECLGEFSSFVEDENDKKIIKKVKLTESEKRLCQVALITHQRKFVSAAFELRKKYLVHRHEQEISILDKMKNSTIKNLKDKAQTLQ